MTNKPTFTTYATIGIMLFGLFFGAGNLIFPIHLGQLAGGNITPALIGFLIVATGLPFMGILAIGLSGSSGLRDLASRVHPIFGITFAFILYLTIGPFFAIPRTATVPFVVGFEPFIAPEHHTLWLLIFSFLFFAIVYYLSLNSAKVMDIIGKYLTPAFLIFLSILIITAIVKPMGGFGDVIGDYQTDAFMTGFQEGYNTMDALAALAFGIVIIRAIQSKGITSMKEIAMTTWKSGLVALVLMVLIYSLIAYMGVTSVATTGILENGGLTFSAVSSHYFGPFGLILLAIIILLACLKTSIGLIVACSEFFHRTFPSIGYKTFVLVLSAFSFLMANLGLTNIIQYAVPVLMFLYPLAIVLILLGIFSKLFHNKQAIYLFAMIFTILVSIIDGYQSLLEIIPGISNTILNDISSFYQQYLPLYDIGLGWILPAVLGFCIGAFIKGNKSTRGELQHDITNAYE